MWIGALAIPVHRTPVIKAVRGDEGTQRKGEGGKGVLERGCLD